MPRSEDAIGDGNGRRERDGGTLNGQRGSFEWEDLGRLPCSTRSPVALTCASSKYPDPVDSRGSALTPWSWKYPLELRERAVRMYRTAEPKPVIRRMAEDLGVHHEALRNWIRQAEADAGERGDVLTTAEREELAVLRKENVQLKRANEVLRTASAFFAAQLDPTRPR
ncbi:transposase [Streptomyces sp. H27-H1]|uniref:transposase n=1 Tax=unclassified Streptomyces TaxID=2593676 RepID=UPI00226DAA07|nr:MULTISPECIES: transposase [unclassified Streptomyces]MCY0926945.1 transposase [Streptomyces sp. H27-H1]MCY0933209.1 transposase [Streptomyces sp. H34-S4]